MVNQRTRSHSLNTKRLFSTAAATKTRRQGAVLAQVEATARACTESAALLQILGASLLLQLFGLALPLLTAVVVDTIIPFGMKDVLVLLSIGFLILMLAQLVATLLRSSVLLYLQTRVDTSMMLGFFEQLLALPQRFFLQRSTGDLLSPGCLNEILAPTRSLHWLSVYLCTRNGHAF